MTLEDKTSRLAGFLYLVVVVTGIFSLGYVPSQIPLSGDPRTAIDNIKGAEQMFRFGIAAFIILQVSFLLLPLVLFKLLRPVNEAAAICMVVLAVVSVPLALVALSGRMDLLLLATNTSYTEGLGAQQVHAEVLLALGQHRNQLLLTKVFWGLWLFPFGWLVFKSGFLPKILGLFLMLGCFGYLVEVFGRLLVPGYAESAVARFAVKPASIGEIGTCLWLLIVGVRRPCQPREMKRGQIAHDHVQPSK
ncbi:MAG: DUF4386 domain-containing protein [Nibricoccus sp.]